MISRRNFLTLASGLLLPEPVPVRVYSFVGGWNPVTAHVLVDGERVYEIRERDQGGSLALLIGGSGTALLGVEVVDAKRFRCGQIMVQRDERILPGDSVAWWLKPPGEMTRVTRHWA